MFHKEDRSSVRIEFEVVSIDKFDFMYYRYANCYVFESDQVWSPWVMSLAKYLPEEHDWTTTYEILKETGSDPQSNLGVVCQLLGQGKVIPLEPFAVTWLFMRRPFTELFSYEACEKIGCSLNLRNRIIGVVRRELGGGRSIEDFLEHSERWWKEFVRGVGPKMLTVMIDILNLYGFKFAER